MSNHPNRGVVECPNCCEPFSVKKPHPENGCVLAALVGVVADRGATAQKTKRLIAKCDVDALWEDIRGVLNKLEDGEYIKTVQR